METNLVYFDETGDDGLIKTSSETFILTSIYMTSENWQKKYLNGYLNVFSIFNIDVEK